LTNYLNFRISTTELTKQPAENYQIENNLVNTLPLTATLYEYLC